MGNDDIRTSQSRGTSYINTTFTKKELEDIDTSLSLRIANIKVSGDPDVRAVKDRLSLLANKCRQIINDGEYAPE